MIYTAELKDDLSIRVVPFTREQHMNENYFNWFHDSEVTKHNSHGLFPYTKKQQEEFIKGVEDSTTKIVWAIEIVAPHVRSPQTRLTKEEYENPDLKDITHIGNCALQRIDYINSSAEFAIVLGDKDYWGKGVCSAALDLVIQHAFKKLGLNRVWTGTTETNIGMQKAAEKCQMTKEGVFRQGMFLNGKHVDIYVYSRLAYEYFAWSCGISTSRIVGVTNPWCRDATPCSAAKEADIKE